MSVVKDTTRTTTGNQTFTGDLGGDTPKVALFYFPRHAPTNDPNRTSTATIAIGATDGTRQWAGAVYSQDNQASTNTARSAYDTACVLGISGALAVHVASFVSFSANAVTVNFTTTEATGRSIVCVLLSGADLNAYVGTTGGTEGTKSHTGVGFQADAILLASFAQLFNEAGTDAAVLNFGCVVNDGSLTQKNIYWFANDGHPAGSASNRMESDSVRENYNDPDSTAVTAIGSDGFTTVCTGVVAEPPFGFIALKFGGLAFKLWTFQTPTSTGNRTDTTPGLEPVGAIMCMSSLAALDSTVSDTGAASFGLSAWTAAGEQATGVICVDIGADPTNTEMDCKAHALQCGISGTGCQAIVADFVSVQSDGFTLDYTAVNGTARYGWALAFGSGATVVEVGLATETDTALSVAVGGIDVGLITETDSALSFQQEFQISFVAEVDDALSISPVRSYALGFASETDSALAATAVKHLGIPEEFDSALSLARIITFPTETDTALSLRAIRTWAIGLAEETDSILALTLVDGIAEQIGMATETDSALSVLNRRLALAEETDEALAILALVTDYWPFDDLKPRHIGIHKIASPIGGGTAITKREPTISSGNGFWRIVYGGIPVKTRTQILLWRAMEIKFEGRGASLLIPIYDGKRAPWPGTPGGSLQAVADAAVAAGATSIAIDGTGLAALQAGMHFSAGHYLHRIQAITATVGDVYTCTIWPKTREAIADGAALEFGIPRIRVRLADDDAMRLPLTHHRFGEGNITFIEDVP